ncbi:MAG TPA: copper resistance protein CopC [Micromonosporaceae bacterium]|nr:copper resistance protein CopC [Micromonosporaceae bacterium]
MRRVTSRLMAFAGLALCGLVMLLLPAAPASAHAVLLRATPAPDSVLAAGPSQVVLEFSEPVRLIPGKIRIVGPDGKRADDGEPSASGGVVTVPVRPGGPRGTYLVSYRVISADSHPVVGGFAYSVGAPSATAVDGGVSDDVDPFVRAAIPVAKYLGYAGLVLVVGPALVLAMLWPSRLSRRGPARVLWTGMGLVAVSTVAGLLLQAPYTTGTALTDLTGADLRQVFASQFGTAHLVRLVVLAGSALLLVPLVRGASGVVERTLLVVFGVVAAGTWPLSGHPAGSPVPAVSVAIDVVHLASMAVWLGGLVMLIAFLLRRADEEELGAILPVWSRWAALAVAALLLAGLTQALIEVGTPTALVSTSYGQLILTKVGLFAAVVAVAAFSRRLVRQRVAAGRPGRLRRLIGAELGITAVVLALTTVLVQTTPARTAEANETVGDLPFSSTAASSLYSLQVEVDPAKVGRNDVHLYAYTPDGKPLPVVEWQASAALPAAGVEPIDLPLLKLTDNHATGQISLPTAGDWRLRFTLRISEIDQATVNVTVPIT